MKANQWSDEQWGKGGASLWLLIVTAPVMAAVFLYLFYISIFMDLSDAPLVLAILVLMLVVLGDKMVFLVLSIPKLKHQVVDLRMDDTYIRIGCYFNNESNINTNSLSSIEGCNFSFWFKRYSYLSDANLNHCLTTRDGQKFYITGDMPEVESLIETLKSIIQKNQETETENKNVG